MGSGKSGQHWLRSRDEKDDTQSQSLPDEDETNVESDKVTFASLRTGEDEDSWLSSLFE